MMRVLIGWFILLSMTVTAQAQPMRSMWRTSQEVYDNVRSALDEWLADLPDYDRAWYLWSIRRYDLLNTTSPAQVDPPADP